MVIDTHPFEDTTANMFSLEKVNINMFSVNLIASTTLKEKVELTDHCETIIKLAECKIGARRLTKEVRQKERKWLTLRKVSASEYHFREEEL